MLRWVPKRVRPRLERHVRRRPRRGGCAAREPQPGRDARRPDDRPGADRHGAGPGRRGQPGHGQRAPRQAPRGRARRGRRAGAPQLPPPRVARRRRRAGVAVAHRPGRSRSPRCGSRARARSLAEARTCYDHVAGRSGVALHDGLLARGWLVPEPGGYGLSEPGVEGLLGWGVDVTTARAARRPLRPAVPGLDRAPRAPRGLARGGPRDGADRGSGAVVRPPLATTTAACAPPTSVATGSPSWAGSRSSSRPEATSRVCPSLDPADSTRVTGRRSSRLAGGGAPDGRPCPRAKTA